MALDHILKAAPFTWGAGSVGSTGLGIGGWYLHEEVSNASWDHQLWKEGYSLNIPEASSWGPNVTDEDTFEEAKIWQSGDCFKNFFPGVKSDFAKDEEKEDNTDDSQINRSRETLAIGCAIQKISYKEELTKIKVKTNKEWRVLPEYMVYKSEVTFKNEKFGLAIWTLLTGKSSKTGKDKKFKEWNITREHKVFLLKNEDKRWEVKGSYTVIFEPKHLEDWKITNDKIVPRKITMEIKEKQEIWFDTSVTYTDSNKKDYKVSDKWTNYQSVSFWEGGGGKEFANILVMGSDLLPLFTGKSTDPKNFETEKTPKNLLPTWYKPFKGIKGEWKEPKEFCEYMQKTKGKNVSRKDAYMAKNLCYTKVAVAQGDTQSQH